MGKFFNIAGPCNPADHYMLPASARLPDVVRLVDDEVYFVVHAPRQCGKTTAFQALADEINAKGERVALVAVSASAVTYRLDPAGRIELGDGIVLRTTAYAKNWSVRKGALSV